MIKLEVVKAQFFSRFFEVTSTLKLPGLRNTRYKISVGGLSYETTDFPFTSAVIVPANEFPTKKLIVHLANYTTFIDYTLHGIFFLCYSHRYDFGDIGYVHVLYECIFWLTSLIIPTRS